MIKYLKKKKNEGKREMAGRSRQKALQYVFEGNIHVVTLIQQQVEKMEASQITAHSVTGNRSITRQPARIEEPFCSC